MTYNDFATPDRSAVRYAGFWTRFAAFFLDGVILYIPNAIINYIVFAMFGMNALFARMQAMENEPMTEEQAAEFFGQFAAVFFPTLIVVMISSTLLTWLYCALMESSAKQATLGKMALGIVVTDLNGKRISFGRATGRYFMKAFISGILLIGYIMAAFTEKKQGLHDLVAGTLVVRRR